MHNVRRKEEEIQGREEGVNRIINSSVCVCVCVCVHGHCKALFSTVMFVVLSQVLVKHFVGGW